MLPVTSTVLCLVGVATLVSAYPFEVPTSACEDMTPKGPGHENAKPLSSRVPFDFVLERTTIRNSDTVEFTIRTGAGKAKSFAAFMVQARDDKSGTPLKPLGTFAPKGTNARTVACSAENDTGSHNSPDPKTSVTLIWTPPTNYKGRVTFYATVAETKLKFWVHQRAGTVDVK